ncbi:MAG: CvpA family protein [Sphingomonadales bacterium]
MEFFSTITAFDATILAIIGFSAFRGIRRGFTTELLTLVSWFGALMITLYGIGFGASDLTRQYIKPESLADVVTVLGLFLVSFLVLKYLAKKIGEQIKDSPVGILDRSLGALFGLLRGLVVVAAGYLIADFFLSEKELQGWVKDSRTKPLVSYSAEMLATIVPNLVDKAKEMESKDSLLETIKKNAPTPSELAAKGKGYTEEMRDKLKEILEGEKEPEEKKKDGGGG